MRLITVLNAAENCGKSRKMCAESVRKLHHQNKLNTAPPERSIICSRTHARPRRAYVSAFTAAFISTALFLKVIGSKMAVFCAETARKLRGISRGTMCALIALFAWIVQIWAVWRRRIPSLPTSVFLIT